MPSPAVFFPGYLAPQAPQPLEGTALQDFLQQIVVGITGLDGTMVRPRWLSEPNNIPLQGQAWCAIGIVRRTKDTNAVEQHNPSNDLLADGSTTLQRHEALHLVASFYANTGSEGDADKYAELLADGFQVDQNREVLSANGFGFVESGEPTPMPSLLKEKWFYRVDLDFTIRRQIDRTYGVPTIRSADIEIITDTPTPVDTRYDQPGISWDDPGVAWDGQTTLGVEIDVEPPV